MNILILTSEYPNPNSKFDTPVVHYFAKEWKSKGNNVQVVHYRSVFPIIFYWVANTFGNFVKQFFKTDFIPTKPIKKQIKYQLDGIQVYSEPIFKIFPHFRFFSSTIDKHVNIIVNRNLENLYTPDIIIGHFYNPQLELIGKLKSIYPNSITSLVLHENPSVLKQTFRSNVKLLLDSLDFIGFRFEQMKIDFEIEYGNKYKTFICPSGIPAHFIDDKALNNKFKNSVMSFCFAGMLIPLKNVDTILDALKISFPEKDFIFTIIGNGMLENALIEKVKQLEFINNVRFIRHLTREEVQSEMSNSDCFVMVSKPEAFGLVYLEAMGKGCITIGTQGQGIDGVIKDGINGFLCEAKNVEKLAILFNKIKTMKYEEKAKISINAILTAKEMTDANVAEAYLKKITNI